MIGGKLLGALMRGHWRMIALIVIIVAQAGTLAIRSHQIAKAKAEIAQLDQALDLAKTILEETKETYRNAQSAAKLEAEAVRLAQEKSWKDEADNAQKTLVSQRDGARADAAAYIGRLRSISPTGACASGSSGPAGATQIARSTQAASGADQMSQLDAQDVRICTDNTIAALGWQPFYQQLRDAQERSAQK